MTKFIVAFRSFAKAPNKTKTSISLAGSEPTISAIELPQTYTLDHIATSNDLCTFHNSNSINKINNCHHEGTRDGCVNISDGIFATETLVQFYG